ncbi:mitochondrial small ribosomal subunit Rsm22-domain-containing protein [Sphaerosporella brunnea]|uniref:Mitochondrial small ribosomal subunit Rsm22-domain-containing protein n=1 Tax=Sphaerosporella brunnea TaxID=1250544 RepID=A0A5J5F7X2_9PEZI|nr:mitochondrial small ribosomal subunit Rsm22-domain-containing protein [Sphaerosporella brunnea]
MLVARRSLRLTRVLTRQKPIVPKSIAFRTFTTTTPATNDLPNQYANVRGRPTEQPIESYVRTVRDTWGDNLPEGLLSEEEFQVYQRYYGAPVRMLTPEEIEQELEFMEAMNKDVEEDEQGAVTLEDIDGVEIVQEEGEESEEASLADLEETLDMSRETQESEADAEISAEELQEIQEGKVRARSAKEARLYEQLGRDIERSLRLAQESAGEELYVEEEEEVEDSGETVHIRTHPLTQFGRFGTFPATVRLPETVLGTTRALLSDVNNKHLGEAAEKILGPRLEESPIMTGKYGRNINKIPLDTSHGMSDMESNVFLATVLPGYYAQSLSALKELRRRLGRDWVLGNQYDEGETGVKHVLDVGTGGAGILAWRAVVEAEQALRDEEAAELTAAEPAEPTEPTEPDSTASGPNEHESTEAGEFVHSSRPVVVIGSDRLRFRMSKMLENTTFIPRLPQVHADTSLKPEHGVEQPVLKQPRKLYDLIIATNTLLSLHEDHTRRYHVQNLWSLLNPNGGVLLLIEKGNARGFEAIAGARQNLLNNNISRPGAEFVPPTEADDINGPRKPKEIGSIVAPCTNHEECPMFVSGPGKSLRRDYCSFLQRYERPTYLQRIIGATRRNHEDFTYSYVAVRRGIDVTRSHEAQINPKTDDFDTTVSPPKSPYSMQQLRTHAFSLPRNVFPPMKRDKHVIMDMCTPAGKIERWTVPKSYGKVAFRDARKVKWGDLWALGAKTKILRNLSLGHKQPRTVAKNDELGEEPVKPGGKKKNPGKNQRERRKAQQEARRTAQLDREDAVRMVAEGLNEEN